MILVVENENDYLRKCIHSIVCIASLYYIKREKRIDIMIANMVIDSCMREAPEI